MTLDAELVGSRNVVTLGLALAIVAGKVLYSPRRLPVAARRAAR